MVYPAGWHLNSILCQTSTWNYCIIQCTCIVCVCVCVCIVILQLVHFVNYYIINFSELDSEVCISNSVSAINSISHEERELLIREGIILPIDLPLTKVFVIPGIWGCWLIIILYLSSQKKNMSNAFGVN